MTNVLSIIFIVAIIYLIVRIVRKRKEKKRASRPIRVPSRIDSSPSVRSAAPRRKPTPINGRSATSIIQSDNDYMNFRYCPDCHSRNKEGKQVIYKTARRSFECKRCGCKFTV